jgi:hypothetical protein
MNRTLVYFEQDNKRRGAGGVETVSNLIEKLKDRAVKLS